jgi:hypothetical protein
MKTKEQLVAEMEASENRFREILNTAQARWGEVDGLRYLYFYLVKGAELNHPQTLDWLEESISR